jgi:hypothetical protein
MRLERIQFSIDLVETDTARATAAFLTRPSCEASPAASVADRKSFGGVFSGDFAFTRESSPCSVNVYCSLAQRAKTLFHEIIEPPYLVRGFLFSLHPG